MASAVGIAGLGDLYPATAEHAPALSHTGLDRAVTAIDVILAATAICAAWTVTRPRKDPR